MPRVRFRIRTIMIVIAVLAVLLGLLVDLDMKDEARTKSKRASWGWTEVVTLAKTPPNKELQRCKRQECSSVPWTVS
jgi:hypothetical protein